MHGRHPKSNLQLQGDPHGPMVCQPYTEPSLIIRNGNPNLASEFPSARGRRFTQLFTNNYALQSTMWLRDCVSRIFKSSVFSMKSDLGGEKTLHLQPGILSYSVIINK